MKNAIAIFIKEHPFLTFFIVTTVCSEARNAVVGITQAITGKYPPEKPETQLPKVDISVAKPEASEESAEETEEFAGEVVTADPEVEDFLN